MTMHKLGGTRLSAKGSGNFGHAGRPGQQGGSRSASVPKFDREAVKTSLRSMGDKELTTYALSMRYRFSLQPHAIYAEHQALAEDVLVERMKKHNPYTEAAMKRAIK